MPTWRCPHCGTPQEETARCWVCQRSSTACGTCRHFRRSVAAQLGYCGLDRRREPLAGDEIRACWEATPTTNADPGAARPPARAAERAARLEFVEITSARAGGPPISAGAAGGAGTTSAEAPAPFAPPPGVVSEPGWSLWRDLEL